jgi:hypothetical protein
LRRHHIQLSKSQRTKYWFKKRVRKAVDYKILLRHSKREIFTRAQSLGNSLKPVTSLHSYQRHFLKMSNGTLQSWHVLYRMYTANRDEFHKPTKWWRKARIHTGCHKCKSSKEGQ